MSKLRPFLTLYEINAWVWLSTLQAKYGKRVGLGSVAPTIGNIATYGLDAVWLTGVWERSPAGMAIANQNAPLLESFRQAFLIFVPRTFGSPACVRQYVFDAHLGGPEGLARRELAKRGHEVDLGLRAEPCRAGSSLGERSSRILRAGPCPAVPWD